MGFEFNSKVEASVYGFNLLEELASIINCKNNIGKAYVNNGILYWNISEADDNVEILSFIKNKNLIYKIKDKMQTNMLSSISNINIDDFLLDLGDKKVINQITLIKTIYFLVNTYNNEHILTRYIPIYYNILIGEANKWDAHDWYIFCVSMDTIGKIVKNAIKKMESFSSCFANTNCIQLLAPLPIINAMQNYFKSEGFNNNQFSYNELYKLNGWVHYYINCQLKYYEILKLNYVYKHNSIFFNIDNLMRNLAKILIISAFNIG